MKSFLFSLLLVAATNAMAQQSPALSDFFKKLKAGEKQTVVAYGTSLTKDGAWVPMMQQWFEKKFPGQVTVVNSGGRGQNSDWGAAQVANQVLVHNPNLVLIEFSYNDAHQRFKLTPEHCKANLDTIIDAIQKKDPKAAIILQTMNAPWDPPQGKGFADSAKNRPDIEAYNENYRTSAKEKNLPLVDNYPVFLKIKEANFPKYQSIVPDGSHPNKAGSAEVTWPGVKAVLEAASA